jgi:hypothetical protein
MKKFLMGIVCGAFIAGGTTVYAMDSIQALLFPAKYEINGMNKDLPNGYKTLNVDGHAYVPIRFISESLKAVAAYDKASNTIRIDDGFDISSENGIRAGHLVVNKSGELSNIKGKIYVSPSYWETMANSRNYNPASGSTTVGGTLLFYNKEGNYLGKAPIEVNYTKKEDQIKDFESSADADISGYAFTMFAGEFPTPMGLPVPPDVSIEDPTSKAGIGMVRVTARDGFSEVRGWISLKEEGVYRYRITMTFLDDNGNELGTAELNSIGEGKDPKNGMQAAPFETAGKGDFTKFKDVKIRIDSFIPASLSE